MISKPMTKIFNKKTGALSALSATLLLAVIMSSMPSVYADDTICAGGLLPVATYDNVVVPAGASCEMDPGTIVTGNVQADGAFSVNIDGVTVTGNIEIKNSIAGGFVIVTNSNITGNLKMEDNLGDFADVTFNTVVGGDIQHKKNITTFVSFIAGNTVMEGNLQCEDNAPAPLDLGFANIVPNGNKEGQCSLAAGFS